MSIVLPTPPTPRRCSAQRSAARRQQVGHRVGEFRAVKVAAERTAVLPTARAEAEQPPRPVEGQLGGAREQRRDGLAGHDELLRAAQVLGLDGEPHPLDESQFRCACPSSARPSRGAPKARRGRAPRSRSRMPHVGRTLDGDPSRRLACRSAPGRVASRSSTSRRASSGIQNRSSVGILAVEIARGCRTSPAAHASRTNSLTDPAAPAGNRAASATSLLHSGAAASQRVGSRPSLSMVADRSARMASASSVAGAAVTARPSRSWRACRCPCSR